VWFVGAVTVGAVLLAVTGCERAAKKPAGPPPGFTAPVNGVCFRLGLRLTAAGVFVQEFHLANQRPDTWLFFGPEKHVLELRVFREDGSEVAPSVVRSERERKSGSTGSLGPNSVTGTTWESPWPMLVDSEYLLADGTKAKYGKHTLDDWTRAWDLAPGKYTVRPRFRSKSATEEPYGNGYEKTSEGEMKPAFYWAGDVELKPVEIEVP
jgi:hypothetical protein